MAVPTTSAFVATRIAIIVSLYLNRSICVLVSRCNNLLYFVNDIYCFDTCEYLLEATYTCTECKHLLLHTNEWTTIQIEYNLKTCIFERLPYIIICIFKWVHLSSGKKNGNPLYIFCPNKRYTSSTFIWYYFDIEIVYPNFLISTSFYPNI